MPLLRVINVWSELLLKNSRNSESLAVWPIIPLVTLLVFCAPVVYLTRLDLINKSKELKLPVNITQLPITTLKANSPSKPSLISVWSPPLLVTEFSVP